MWEWLELLHLSARNDMRRRVLSTVFLIIARCSVCFNYPMCMVLFLRKADNLNDFMQTTTLRVYTNFSENHHAHQTFGILVGFETASHTFFPPAEMGKTKWWHTGEPQFCSRSYLAMLHKLKSTWTYHFLHKASLEKPNKHHRYVLSNKKIWYIWRQCPSVDSYQKSL